MKFCQPHWDALREAIESRGLSSLIAESGEQAVANLRAEMEGKQTLENYDPLQSAHWAIVNNVLGVVGGPNALYLVASDEPQKDEKGVEWPVCPLCYLNQAHRMFCNDPACVLDKEHGYDVWIARAADEQKQRVEGLLAGGSA